MRDKYNTNSKKIIMEKVKTIEMSFSAKELKEMLDLENKKIGLTTIYRILDELVEREEIKKYFTDNNIANYQYLDKCDKENHFYLKCKNCNRIIHIDCDCIKDFSNHILKTHGFNLMDNNILITGICNNCKKIEEN